MSNQQIKYLIFQISANNGIELTFNDLRLQSVRAAQNLKIFNFQKGDYFAVISKNNHELFPTVIAALCSGHPVSVLSMKMTESELTDALYSVKPRAIFCEQVHLDLVNLAVQKLNFQIKVFTFLGAESGSIAVSSLFTETGNENSFT